MIATVMPGSASSGRLLYVDGLRGLAALVVAVMYHYVHFSGDFQPGGAAMSAAPWYDIPIVGFLYVYGYLGVDVFFLISGYVFAAVYSDELAAARVSGWSFFVRRFARLYPIHLLTLLLAAVLVYIFFFTYGRFPVYRFNGLGEFMLNLLFMQAGTLERGYSFNGPAWSLSCEAVAYLVFFFIAVRGTGLRWVGAAIAAGLLLVWFGNDRNWHPMVFCTIYGKALVGFFLGVLVQQLGPMRPWLTASLIAVISAVSIVTATYADRPRVSVALTWLVFGLVLLALQRWPVLRRPFELRPMILLGDLSLGVYLLHFPVQVVILLLLGWLQVPVPFNSLVFLISYAAAVLVAAYATHVLFELPAQRYLRRRLMGRPHKQPVLGMAG